MLVAVALTPVVAFPENEEDERVALGEAAVRDAVIDIDELDGCDDDVSTRMVSWTNFFHFLDS